MVFRRGETLTFEKIAFFCIFWICTGLERNPLFHLEPCISFETGANSPFQFLHISRVPFLVVFELLLDPLGTLLGPLWRPLGSLGTPLAPFGPLSGVFLGARSGFLKDLGYP